MLQYPSRSRTDNIDLAAVEMPEFQMSPRYCNPEGLVRFLRAEFPNVKDFMIREVGGNVDSAYLFYAPRSLSAVSILNTATY